MTRALIVAALLAASAPARAQDNSQLVQDLKSQVEALTKRVAELEAKDTTQAATSAPLLHQATPALPPSPGKLPDRGLAQAVPAPLDRPLQPDGAAFMVNATSDSSQVAIKLATTVSKPNLNGRTTGTATSDSIAITASAPLQKNAPRTDLGTLDGFTNSSTLKFRWTRFAMPIASARLHPRNIAIVELTRSNCRNINAGKPDALKECDGPMSDELVGKYTTPELQGEYLSLGFPRKPSFAFGLEGSVGYRKFEFLDPVTLAKGSDEKVPWGVKLFGTIFPGPSLTSITGAFEYQSAYEEHKASTICPVDVEATFVECISGSLGGPDHKKKALGSLELRHLFVMPDGVLLKSLGVSAQLTHDFKSDVTGFDLPVYLIPDAKGNLLGGIRLGYRTDTDDVAFGVFVGSAFSFR